MATSIHLHVVWGCFPPPPRQSWVVPTEIRQPAKSKIFPDWPSMENFGQPLCQCRWPRITDTGLRLGVSDTETGTRCSWHVSGIFQTLAAGLATSESLRPGKAWESAFTGHLGGSQVLKKKASVGHHPSFLHSSSCTVDGHFICSVSDSKLSAFINQGNSALFFCAPRPIISTFM